MEIMDATTLNSRKKCAVNGCDTRGGRMFQFPNPRINRERFEKWVLASCNEKLFDTKKVSIWPKSMCVKHFERRYILNRRLTQSAIPTLNLPNPIVEKQGACLNVKSSDDKETFVEETMKDLNKEVSLNVEKEEDRVQSPQINATDENEPQKKKIEKEIFPILHFIGVTSRKDLTPREEKLYNIIISMRKSMHELRRSRDSVNQRLALVEAEMLKKSDAKS